MNNASTHRFGSVMSALRGARAPQQQAVAPTQTLGYLGRALSLEFSAGQQYLAQSALAEARGELDYAKAFVDLANEEFQHANLITRRMVAYGALPAGSVLKPADPATDVISSLRICEVRELELIQLYAEALQFSQNTGVEQDVKLFSQLLEEERAQLLRVQEWINQYMQLLNQQWAQLGTFR
ncbi:bacterioferritin [Sulfurivirga caldicuralii]|uniref:Bacterioferritin n=1 Tax=Sulfurivirga caldicuralii TaxID=364032 RepID=A0A1N6DKK5_9GAMM|nr:ferritin-like domain-containing protein [Sulfurivirga caldicuralii]SIN71203.1 bacterioferritin [Sulfurivirga caldicuralii]